MIPPHLFKNKNKNTPPIILTENTKTSLKNPKQLIKLLTLKHPKPQLQIKNLSPALTYKNFTSGKPISVNQI
jgi:hypothetical protein